jgi:hypothetical protein
VKVDFERLKKDVNPVLNNTFFDKLGDVISSVEVSANSKPGAAVRAQEDQKVGCFTHPVKYTSGLVMYYNGNIFYGFD